MAAELKKVPRSSSWEKQVAESTAFQQGQFLDEEGQNDSLKKDSDQSAWETSEAKKAGKGRLNQKLTCEERVFSSLSDSFSDCVLNVSHRRWGNTLRRLLWEILQNKQKEW